MADNALIGKIAKAGLDVGGKLRADKTNKEQNYGYISADKILAVGGQALFNQGVAVIPQVIEQETSLYEYTDNYGKSKRRYDSRVTFHFTVSDGAQAIETAWVGMGSDYMTPDKALYKAVTSGHKYFLMKLLSIGEGNEDGEHETDDEPQVVQRQTARTNGKQVIPQPPDELPVVEREAVTVPPAATYAPKPAPRKGNAGPTAFWSKVSELVAAKRMTQQQGQEIALRYKNADWPAALQELETTYEVAA